MAATKIRARKAIMCQPKTQVDKPKWRDEPKKMVTKNGKREEQEVMNLRAKGKPREVIDYYKVEHMGVATRLCPHDGHITKTLIVAVKRTSPAIQKPSIRQLRG